MVAIILGMFAVTFSIRFVLYARAHRVTLPDWVENGLRFVPVAVLTAIITPMILMPDNQWGIDGQNPWLAGSLVAFIVGLWRQQPLLTIVSGVSVFFMWKWLAI